MESVSHRGLWLRPGQQCCWNPTKHASSCNTQIYIIGSVSFCGGHCWLLPFTDLCICFAKGCLDLQLQESCQLRLMMICGLILLFEKPYPNQCPIPSPVLFIIGYMLPRVPLYLPMPIPWALMPPYRPNTGSPSSCSPSFRLRTLQCTE